MYAKIIRPSAKREVQAEQSTKRDDRIAHDENVPARRTDFHFSLQYDAILILKKVFWVYIIHS